MDDTTPAFHYGTHYSSAAIVASYLVRMEPFTQHFIKVQGGHFDHPDRMFHSVADSWLSASERNNADVKELIPEFYYLPEFLTNTNRFIFGMRQNKEVRTCVSCGFRAYFSSVACFVQRGNDDRFFNRQ